MTTEGEGFVYGVQTERFKRECQRLGAALDPVTASVLRDSGLDMSELRERLKRLRRRIEDFEHVMTASNQDKEPNS